MGPSKAPVPTWASEALEIGGEGRDAGRLDGIVGRPAGDLPAGTRERPDEMLLLAARGNWQGAHACERGLARGHPAIDEGRMAHEERRHAKAGGVADAEPAAQRRSKGGGSGAAAQYGHVLHEIGGEGADEVDGQHLRAEGAGKLRAARDDRAIGDAELAVAVDGRGAHEIAGCLHLGCVRLTAVAQGPTTRSNRRTLRLARARMRSLGR